MDEFRAEIRKLVLRLAFVTATCEDRKMTKEAMKKQEAVGNMSCKESPELQAALDRFDWNIRAPCSRKSTTVHLPNCHGVIHTVGQDEVKVSK
eukprot:8149196-Ditylum_brightwellii.AAC.1